MDEYLVEQWNATVAKGDVVYCLGANKMILFLDFDGVTHPVFPKRDLPDDEN